MEYNQSTVNYWKAFVLPYTFALEELKTKFEIMNREAQFLEDYNPFEHIKTRLKQPESIIKKLERKSLLPTVENAQTHLQDIKLIFLDIKKKIPCVDHIFLWTPCRIKLSKQCLLVTTKQALPFSTLS